jgi:hypothetical protein
MTGGAVFESLAVDPGGVVSTSALRVGIESALIGGLVGAVGGMLAAWVAYSFERGRDRERLATEMKAASRLVDDELRNAFDAATSIRTGEPFARLPIAAWVGERVRLAGTFEHTDWEAVAKAYDRVNGYNWRLEAAVLEDEDERLMICEKLIQDIPPARERLKRYLGP